jgi:sugar phosphate isomerase/epimerase
MLTRRSFLAQTSATAVAAFTLPVAGALAQSAPGVAGAAPAGGKYSIITFTKPFQKLSFDDTADVIAEVGYDGVELPLRANGQILPERAADELPLLVEALKKRGKTVGLLTTDIYSPDAPHAEKILRTAKALGITRYRLGFRRYDLTKPIQPQLDALKPGLKDLAAMNKDIGVTGGIQNHSGAEQIGAAVWDLYELVRAHDPAQLGICFDIGHATIEGGLSWPVPARLMQPWFTCVYVKDATWERNPKGGYTTKWGALGGGVVHGPEFFKWLKSTPYAGAISQHCEYLTGAKPEDRAQMKKDLALLKEWLG